ncbi:MAG: porphobilinogen synthase [Acidobacteria bacterium]|nr:porphobilinogen synthase [Acidobacteriota bacterium]|tara:strand:- start:2356 stop:3384 length:1029 start_codon:yes stop_codon:yes gene_type:complete
MNDERKVPDLGRQQPSSSQTHLNLRNRPRRLRQSAGIRDLTRETRLSADMLVYPLFICEGTKIRREIPSMPGINQLSVDEAVIEVSSAIEDGVRAVLLFGLPAHKDNYGSSASDPNAPVQKAIRAFRTQFECLTIITDVCLCEYTSHGHCGLLNGKQILNDTTVTLLVDAALSHAESGAHVVAPSDMMDGRVGAIRTGLDQRGFHDVAIMSYAAKYCSAFYGPFRDAADSAPAFGDRRTHQMDPANTDEALREVALDLEEGADIVMVKPAMPYLDIIQRIKTQFQRPTAAYQVSGEYSMLKAAAQRNWIDEPLAMLESLTAIKRAGADIIITYYARDVARLL